jgi:hypothetical protein
MLALLLLPFLLRECMPRPVPAWPRPVPAWPRPDDSKTLLSLGKLDWKLELLLLRRPRDVWLDNRLESSPPSRSELYEYWWPWCWRPAELLFNDLNASKGRELASSYVVVLPPVPKAEKDWPRDI